MNNEVAAPSKKQYAAPKLNKVPPEEAKELLLEQVAHGGHEAKDLLNLLSERSA
jgi:hypothetical protein